MDVLRCTIEIMLWLVFTTILGGISTHKGEALQNCGIRKSPKEALLPLRRIVGGKNTSVREWPWMAALLLNNQVACGGSLVAPGYVVTAAHCFSSDPDTDHWKVVLGQTKPSGSSAALNISSVKKHPLFLYNAEIKFRKPCDYDIALIKMASNTTLNEAIFPICLLPETATFDQKSLNCHVLGWGRTSSGGPQSPVLQETRVDIVSTEVCNREECYNGTIHKRVLCAGPASGGCGPCQFDSGGPLACEDNGHWYLHGLVSYGIGCALPNKYGVYSNMYQLTSWVKNEIRSDR